MHHAEGGVFPPFKQHAQWHAVSYLYSIKLLMSVCVSVCVMLIEIHSFARIDTKSGIKHL